MATSRRSSITSYLKNLGKSLGYATADVVGEYTPVAKGIIDATRTTYREVKDSMKEISASASEKSKSFSSDVIANTLDDLKTGKWYNKEREESSMFGDFDFDDDFGDFEDWGDDDISGSDAAEDIMATDTANTKEIISSMGRVSSGISKSIGYASARNAEYIVAHTRASNAALYNLNAKGFNQVSTILLNMDNTVSNLAQLGQPLNTFMENSFTFYTNTTNSLNKITESLDILVKRSEIFEPKQKKSSGKANYASIFSGGEFDAGAYTDMVKGNIKELAEMAQGIGSMIGMMTGGGMGGKNTVSLTSMMLKFALKAMMPTATKESFKQFDKALSNAIGRGFKQMSSSNNILVSILSSIFAPESKKFSTSVGTKFERGPIPWDGDAKQALVQVIPTYLAKLNAILGGEEKYYDYEAGKFVSTNEIRRRKSEEDNRAAIRAGGDFRAHIIKDIGGNNKKLEREIDNFFQQAFLNGKDINLLPYIAEPSLMVRDFGISLEAANRIVKTYKDLKKRSEQGKANAHINTYENWVNDVYIGRDELMGKYATMGGTNHIYAKLSDGSISAQGNRKVQGSSGSSSLGEANTKIIDRYGINPTVALGYVIPEYLEAMYGIMNGGRSFRYDYKTGKFVPIDTDKRNRRRFKNSQLNESSGASPKEANTQEAKTEGKFRKVKYGSKEYKLTEDQYNEYRDIKDADEKYKYLKESQRINAIAYAEDKIKEEKDKRIGQIKGFLGIKEGFKNLAAIPGALASQGLDTVTQWLNSLFWGDGKSNSGIFSKFKDFMSNTVGGFFDKDGKLIANAAAAAGLPKGTADIIIETVDGVKVCIAVDRHGNRIGTVSATAAKKFFQNKDIKSKIVSRRIAGLPSGTVDIVSDMVDGVRIYTCINDNGDKIGTVDEDVARRFYNKKGLLAGIKHSFRKFADTAKQKFFGGSLREYLEDAKEHYEENETSGSWSGLIAGGDSGTGDKKDKEKSGLTGQAYGIVTKIAGDTANSLASGISKVFASLTAGLDNDKDKVLNAMKERFKEISDNKGDIGFGAVAGAGVSLLTGAVVGPLAGAAIGASAMLVAKSSAVQDFLFGKGDPNDPNYEQGMLGDLGEAIKSNPAAAKATGIGGIAGGILGTFVGGSPIVGMIAGSAIGYAAKSEKAQEFLFGTEENRTQLGKVMDEAKKRFPNILGGAAVGALIGPFGMAGKLIAGAAVGYVSASDKFQKFMFGDPDDPNSKYGKYGLMGNINDIVHNLSNAVNGLIKRVTTRVLDGLKIIGKKISDTLFHGVKKVVDSKKDGFLAKVANGLGQGLGGAIFGTTERVKKRLKSHNLRKGNLIYDRELGRNMTAAERMKYADSLGGVKRGAYSSVDEYLSKLSDENFVDLANNVNDANFRTLLANRSKSGELDNVQMTQIKALIKDEKRIRQKNINERKQKEATDPNFPYVKSSNNYLRKIAVRIGAISPEEAKETPEGGTSEGKGKFSTRFEQLKNPEGRQKLIDSYNKKHSGEDTDETHRTIQSDYGPIQLVKNAQGEWVEDMSDSQTKDSVNARKGFLSSIASLPVIGTLATKFGGAFDKLFGEKDENGKRTGGLLGGLMDKLFGENGYLSGLFAFVTGSPIGKVLKSPSSILSGIALPALLVASFTGALDGFFQKLGNLKIFKGNDTESAFADKTSTYGTDAEGNIVSATLGEDGKYYDANGNVVSNVTTAGSDNRWSTQLKKNIVSKTLMGQTSVAGMVANKAAKTWAKAGSKTAKNIVENGGVGKALANGIKNIAAHSADDVILTAMEKIVNAVKGPVLSKILPNTLVSNIDDIVLNVGTGLSEAIAKIGTKATSIMASAAKACAVIYVAGIVTAAVNAYGDAENILGITEKATTGQRFIAMLVAAVNAAIPGIGNLIPNNVIVNLFITIIQKINPNYDFGGLVEQREEAAAEVEAYNQAFGTSMSIEEFNTMGLHYNAETGEVTKGKSRAGIVTRAKSKIKTAYTDFKNKGGIKGAVTRAGESINEFGTAVKDFVQMKFVDPAKKGINTIKKIISDGVTMLESADNINVKQFLTVDVDESNPYAGLGKGIGMIARIFSIPVFMFKKVTKSIKNIFDTIKYSTISAVPDMKKDADILKTKADAGDISGLWTTDEVTGNESEHNLLSKLMPIINTIQKIYYTPSALFHAAFNPVKAIFTVIKNKVQGTTHDIMSDAITLNEKYVTKGDISGLWKADLSGDNLSDDNILAKIMPAINVGQKIALTIPTLISKVGIGIKSIFDKIVGNFTNEVGAYNTAIDALKSAGSFADVQAVTFTKPEGLMNPLHPFLSFSFAINKIGYTIKSIFDNIGSIIGNIGDAIAENPIVQKGTEIVNKVKNFFNKGEDTTANAAAIAKANAEAALAGQGSGFVNQFDPRYQKYSIGGQKFGAKGCGPAVAAMAANAMGKSMSVGQAVGYSNGYQTPDGVTLDYFQSALGSKGIKTELVTGGSSQDMYNRIASGQKMILLGRDPYNTSKDNSPFGPNNHYVLATGVDRRGNVIINDPEARAPRAYNPNILRSASFGVAGGGTTRARRPRRIIRNLRNKYRLMAGGSSLDTNIAQAVWAFFRAKGYSEAATAGIMGNMQAESGIDPSKVQGGGKGPAAGIVQWESYTKQTGRWKAMADYAASKGRNWDDLESQLEYVDWECSQPGVVFWKSQKAMSKAGVNATTFEAFKNSTNVEQATREFEGAFERAGTPHMENRISYAKSFYQMYSGKTTDSSALNAASTAATAAATTTATASTTTGTTKTSGGIGSALSAVKTIFGNVLGAFFSGTTESSDTTTSTTTATDTTAATTATTGATTIGTTAGVTGEKANNFPYYAQTADPWGPKPYGLDNSASTFSKAGCGPTSAAMIMKSYGAQIGNTPESAGAFAVQHGYRKNSGGTAAGIFPSLAAANGLDSKLISADEVMSTLKAGIPVAALMGPGDFTKSGHYIVMSGTKDGGILVNDPASKRRTGQVWDPSILKQVKNGQLYAISKNGVGSISAAGSGIYSYGDIARMAAGSSGLLMNSRVGSRVGKIATSAQRRLAGGASSISEAATNMLTSVKSTVTNAGNTGAISPELVAQLLSAITSLLQSITDNTAPIASIYNALKTYMQSGGASGTKNQPSITPVKTGKNGDSETSSKVDSNIEALVGVLAQLAKG